ncbi:MAG: RluA family pseudouridine synthase [Clostridia bacterium]|nr:RluA family pseudouridine synthase [Clostridia bacterium]
MPHIIYEDNHLLIAEKPQNIPAQADSSGDADFLGMLKDYLKETYHKPGNVYLGLVHRLDRPTGGVMVFAKTSKAAGRLSEQLRTHALHRIYLAVTDGQTPSSGTLCDYLLKDERSNQSRVVPSSCPGAKKAVLHYVRLDSSGTRSLIAVRLETGRSHQIRVQMAEAGFPLVHDVKYNPHTTTGPLALWSSVLTLTHPTTRETHVFLCPPPEKEPWTEFASSYYKEDALLSADRQLQIDTKRPDAIMNSF